MQFEGFLDEGSTRASSDPGLLVRAPFQNFERLGGNGRDVRSGSPPPLRRPIPRMSV